MTPPVPRRARRDGRDTGAVTVSEPALVSARVRRDGRDVGAVTVSEPAIGSGRVGRDVRDAGAVTVSEPAPVRVSGRAGRDTGAVTVEAALALCVLAVVLAGAMAAVACLIGHLRCVDAAREAARLAARDDDAAAVAVVRQAAPNGAELHLARRDGLVTATVTSRAAGGLLPGVQLSASAVAALEPSAGSS